MDQFFRPLEYDHNLLYQMDMFGHGITVDPGATVMMGQISRLSRVFSCFSGRQ